MSSTTLVLAIYRGNILWGVRCRNHDGGLFVDAIQPTQPTPSKFNGLSAATQQLYNSPTMNPVPKFPPPGSVSDHEPSVPSPYPPRATPSPPAGVRVGSTWFDGVSGMVAGQRIMISKEALIGRSGVCDVQFHDPKVSRQHALLRFYNNSYYIQDMQSSGGTFVNNQRVTSQILHDRDQVRIGNSVVVFRRQ